MPWAGDELSDVGGGPAGTWHAAGSDLWLEEQAHGLLHGGDGVAHGVGAAVQGAGEQAVPELGGVGVLAQDLQGLFCGDGVGNPFQDVLQRPAGERGGVEEPLDDLRGLGGIEPGGAGVPAAADGPGDGAGGESFRAFLRHLGSTQPATGSQINSGSPGAAPKGSRTAIGRPPRLRRPAVSSKSSTLVRVASAAPRWASSAGASRSRVLPEPCSP